MNSIPKVSVIMPVYNAEKYIHETIDSILCQSFTDFEFLIIDDGSTDKSFEIVSAYTDVRIKIFKNEKNLGYVATLNKLIALSSGEYIARQDNDDISHPKRLENQVNVLNNDLKVGACGSSADLIGKREGKIRMPLTNEDIRAYMLINTPILHPSVMIRKSLFDQNLVSNYEEDLCPAEDYALWFSISKSAKLINLEDSLLLYRWHDNNYSQIKKNLQLQKANIIRDKILRYSLGIEMTEQEKALYDFLENPIELSTLKAIEIWFLKILAANKIKGYYNQQSLITIFFYYWAFACMNKYTGGYSKKIRMLITSPIFNYFLLGKLLSEYGIRKFSSTMGGLFPKFNKGNFSPYYKYV